MAVASLVSMAGPAQAATPHTAHHAAKPAFQGGNCDYYVSCTSLSNGTLYVSVFDAGSRPSEIQDQYVKTGGGTITARFEYNDGSSIHYDNGAFSQGSGQTKTFEWKNQYPASCAPIVGILSVSGQGTFQTPPVDDC
ncbi:hypothetical protein K7472_08935 [Streptomyces sp. PTM05]|uniref:Secreted protein n=1 Tax=Streptantibioticus parmotrematis TaxID=2873249 RepID=A0ABS7QT18_9ACTN|nr:hypothetical protein [Streptantibioticus parmotrematis]MBY8884972.1 hypothetical protein [Streptantibioticus parmotrematis]